MENEYGSFGCDHDYITYLAKLFRSVLGDEILLYTTDGANDHMVTCGSIPELYATVDFGAGGGLGVQSLSFFLSMVNHAMRCLCAEEGAQFKNTSE